MLGINEVDAHHQYHPENLYVSFSEFKVSDFFLDRKLKLSSKEKYNNLIKVWLNSLLKHACNYPPKSKDSISGNDSIAIFF